jgi:hypothetical protein
MTGLLTNRRGSSKKEGIDSQKLALIFPFFNMSIGCFKEEDVNAIAYTLLLLVFPSYKYCL